MLRDLQMVSANVSEQPMLVLESSGTLRTFWAVRVGTEHMSFQGNRVPGNLWTQDTAKWCGGSILLVKSTMVT